MHVQKTVQEEAPSCESFWSFSPSTTDSPRPAWSHAISGSLPRVSRKLIAKSWPFSSRPCLDIRPSPEISRSAPLCLSRTLAAPSAFFCFHLLPDHGPLPAQAHLVDAPHGSESFAPNSRFSLAAPFASFFAGKRPPGVAPVEQRSHAWTRMRSPALSSALCSGVLSSSLDPTHDNHPRSAYAKKVNLVQSWCEHSRRSQWDVEGQLLRTVGDPSFRTQQLSRTRNSYMIGIAPRGSSFSTKLSLPLLPFQCSFTALFVFRCRQANGFNSPSSSAEYRTPVEATQRGWHTQLS